jgi:hypothetical protein
VTFERARVPTPEGDVARPGVHPEPAHAPASPRKVPLGRLARANLRRADAHVSGERTRSDQVINRLCKAGFWFKALTPRMEIYKKGVQRVLVSRRKLTSRPRVARSSARRASRPLRSSSPCGTVHPQ